MMARPGYKTLEGFKSKGLSNKNRDHYTIQNIDMVAEAIQNLKNYYGSEKVILVGHSGGAATAGIIISRHPSLIDSTVLISCPCNVSKWRSSPKKKEGGVRELGINHLLHIDGLIKSLKKKVGIIIGELDENTFPKLSIDYFELLKKNNVQSELLLINVAHSFWHIYTNKEAIELGKSLVNK